MAKNFAVGSGVPTAPDVERLCFAFPTLEAGTTITKQQISEVIKVDKDANRWKTVVDRWRKKLFAESNVVLRAIPNVGFMVSDPMDRVDVSAGHAKKGVRQVSKASAIASRTDRSQLTTEAARACDHIVNTAAKIQTLIAAEAKTLRYPSTEVQSFKQA